MKSLINIANLLYHWFIVFLPSFSNFIIAYREVIIAYGGGLGGVRWDGVGWGGVEWNGWGGVGGEKKFTWDTP